MDIWYHRIIMVVVKEWKRLKSSMDVCRHIYLLPFLFCGTAIILERLAKSVRGTLQNQSIYILKLV